MNKIILSFAFISAAFFFACSADSGFTSNNPPPLDDFSNGPGGNGSGGGYCLVRDYYGDFIACIPISYEVTTQDCNGLESESDGDYRGSVVSSCN